MRLVKSIGSSKQDYLFLCLKSLITQNIQNKASQFSYFSWVYRVLLILGTLSAALFAPEAVQALNQSDVTINLATDPLLVVDSNFCSTSEGPRAGYVGFTVTNNTGTTLDNLQADLNGLTNGFSLSGGQAQIQFIGALGAGESRTVYWYTQYTIDCTGVLVFQPGLILLLLIKQLHHLLLLISEIP